MAEQPLTYWLDLSGSRYAVRVVKGTEGVSTTSRFDLTFPVEPTDPLDTDAVAGSDAVLTLVRDGEERRITGIVTSVTRRATRKHGNAGAGEIAVVLEPRLATLRHRVDIRVFRDKTAPQIVTEVLEALGVMVEQRLSSSYTVRPYTVQFRESDLAFASRLLEDDGIFYFFDQDDMVVLGDSPNAYDGPLGIMPFRQASGLDVQKDAVTVVGWRGEMTAGKVTLRDFNHEHPSLDMDVEAPSPFTGGAEWYDYPGEYLLPPEGSAKAKLRAEALACQFKRLVGRSFAGGLRPGIRFGLIMSPAGVPDGGYVITAITHDWKLGGTGFDVGFEAQPETVTYRPPVVTPAPVQPNPMTGFVTGPAGADVHCDVWGQVKVHFPWDRLQPKDDRCSHWIPILQDNTGQSSAIARTRWEVLCQFLEGDLDRPVVLGRVYNAEDPFYSPLPEMKYRTSLRSQTSPRSWDGSGTGENFIQIDDIAGFQSINVHAQRDKNIIVANDKSEQIDNTESMVVRGHEAQSIGRDRRVVAKLDMMPDISGNQTKTVGANRTAKLGTTQGETVDKNHTLNIGGSHFRRFGSGDNTNVDKNLTETVGGVVVEGSLRANNTFVERVQALIVGGGIFEIVRKNKTEGSGLARVEAISAVDMVNAKNRIDSHVEKMRRTIVGGMLKIQSMKAALITGMDKLGVKAGSVTLEGATIILKVGGTTVTMKDGAIAIDASKSIRIQTTGANNLGSSTSSQS